MGFRFHVENVRGCERAAGEADPIALIAGNNAAGKTSIEQSIAAALTGDALPIEGLTKGNAGMLVRAGAPGARVELTTERGSTSIMWPSATPVSAGEPPQASIYAAGLSSVVDLPARDRARILSEYLHATPTAEDLQHVLRDKGWPDELIGTIWKLVEQQGFDKAYAIRKERGAELKGRWRQITGVNYGSRVAASYRHDLTDPGLNENDLMAAVAQARRDVDNAVSAAAVSASERDRLSAEADALPDRILALTRAEQRVAEARDALGAAQGHRLSLPPVEQPRTAFCPHCGAEVVIEQATLVEVQLLKPSAEIDHGAVKSRRLAIADADGKVAHANDELILARQAEAEARAMVEAATKARERIANWPRAIETGTDTEAARVGLTRAEKLLTEWRTKREADDTHEKIEANEIVLDLLAPEGLRAEKLRKVLGVFVDVQLAALTNTAGWSPISITTDMAIWYGGRPYGLLSTSEQYRVEITLQVAMACLDGSDAVVIDGADVLDGPQRSALFAMLDASALAAVVCMTLSKREQVPDLEQAGIGRSYWIEGGVLQPLQTVREAA